MCDGGMEHVWYSQPLASFLLCSPFEILRIHFTRLAALVTRVTRIASTEFLRKYQHFLAKPRSMVVKHKC